MSLQRQAMNISTDNLDGSDLIIKKEIHKAGDVFGKLCELPHGFHCCALAAVEDMDPDLFVWWCSIKLIPDQPVFCLPQRVHVMDHKRLDIK